MIQFFKNRKISCKLNVIIGVLLVFILILGSIAIMGFEKIDEYNQELNTNTTMPLFQLMSLKEAFQSQRIRLRDMMMADTVETRTNAYNRLKEAGSRLEKLDKSFREQLEKRPEDSLQSLYKDYATYYEQYVKIIEKAEQLTKEGKIKEAMFYIGEKGEGGMISAYARDAIDAMMNNKLQEQEVKRVEINQLIAKLDRLMMISIAVIIMLAIILGNILAKMITKPIKILMKETNKLADSNMDVKVDIQTKDEIGMLAGAFNKMTTNINDTLHEMNSSSDEVAAGSKQIAYASQALAQGATEQASAIEELTVSIGEVADQTKQNALNAMQASSLAQEVKESAQKGSNQMQDMVVAIKQMNESAQGISKIIKVIDDIAFQTNILALNAAVEAARAGQYGKGFAVVAEEVRNLAARSASAAKETTTMIEDAIEKTQNGTHIVGETEKALVGIVEGVMHVAELVEKISIASNDQATSTVQVNKGIEQVSAVIQSNSATAEETASSSEELSNQAEILKRTVSKFKLREQKTTIKKEIQKKITPEVEKDSYKQKY